MTEPLLLIAVVLAGVAVVLLILLLVRQGRLDPGQLLQGLEPLERSVRDEISKSREESNTSARHSREELTNNIRAFNDTITQQLLTLNQTLDQRLDRLRDVVEQRLQLMQAESSSKLEQVRQNSLSAAQALRDEVRATLKDFNVLLTGSISDMGGQQRTRLSAVVDEIAKLTAATEKKLDAQRTAVDARLKAIQEDNGKQLDQMRATVDEKLQSTLEKRLGDSFKLVSERLEQVYKGLGEMQNLAIGVGDLKKVLTNVKSRGTWGEVQLGAMLEQILTPDQYATNVATKGDAERVEFAVKLPGRGEHHDEIVWLPIDAKFPVEDYQRLLEAQEQGDPQAAEDASKQLELRIKQCAADICTKYIAPPRTTDFAILFLPTEGLFAEVLRRTGLPDYVQRECRVVIAGPTTLWSILNSLQMGFRTLAIEKRSSEVWKVLGAVKTEFGKFGDLLDGVKRKLDQASNNIDDATRKTRTIERKLRAVQELPAAEAQALIALGDSANLDSEADSTATGP
jgi:DNA recombination protein RmuC